MEKAKMNILLVEDNDLDVELLLRGLRKVDASGEVLRARDGIEALEMLRRSDANLPEPFVILLDVNMPRMGGHEFLSELRETEGICDSRVFMLTTSASQIDISRAYSKHVSGYLVKPSTSVDLKKVLLTLKGFWESCENPRGGASAYG